MDKSTEILSQITVHSKYARYLPDLKRRENWDEIVTRNMLMHIKKYPHMAEEIGEAYQYVFEKKVLPSMRSLQFGGKPIEISPNRIYNCLTRDAKFITEQGTKSFWDFEDGDDVSVLTHQGRWRNAKVKKYGKKIFNEIELVRGRTTKFIKATPDHRWFLSNGDVTTSLKVGHKLHPSKVWENNFEFDCSSPFEKLYWCYGYVFGDGTKIKSDGEHKYSMVRLCGDDVQYLKRFEEMGFKTSSSLSLNGDHMVYTGKYLKEVPDPSKDSPELIRAFVEGYLAADGEKNPDWYRNYNLPKYKSIQSSSKSHFNCIENLFELAGYFILSKHDLTGEKTNFGTRGETYKYSLHNHIGTSANTHWSVKSVNTLPLDEDAWCLEVEEDQSFVLSGGIVTGNCAYLPIDDWYAFPEVMFLLLGGSGVGYSVQRHHIDKLPAILKPIKRKRRHLIGDSIEGWAEAIKTLMKSYFFGLSDPVFDYSAIRPKGSPLKTSGGKAPGPQPLHDCIHNIRKILQSKDPGDKLTSLEVHDIVCHIADAVLSGGIRRCLPKNSLVHTKEGLKAIQDIEVGDEVLTKKDKFQKVLAKEHTGKKELVHINTELGVHKSSKDHRWAVLSSLDGSVIWKDAKDLTTNDVLMFIPSPIKGGKNNEKIKFDFKEAIKIPKIVLEGNSQIRLSYAAGIFDADGSCTSKREGRQPFIVASSIYPDYIRQLRALVASLGIPSKIVCNKKFNHGWQDLYSLRVKGRKYKNIFAEMLLPYSDKIKKDYKFENAKLDKCGFVVPKRLLRESEERKKYQNSYWSLNSRVNLNWNTFQGESGEKNYIPIRVENVSIKTGDIEETYDIQVEGDEMFVCEGMLVHNSAMISLFSFDDEEMITCKYGDWWVNNPQRARSNNSVVALRHRIAKSDFVNLWEKIRIAGSGEPGIWFSNSAEMGTNPCKPLRSTILTDKGYLTFEEALKMDSLRVYNSDGKLVDATRPFKTGTNREVFKILLSNGMSLYGTNNHKHQLVNGKWVELRDLKVGDKLSYKVEQRISLSIDNKEEYEHGLLMGWLYGDGWNFQRSDSNSKRAGLCFGAHEMDVVSLFEEILGKTHIDHSQKPKTCKLIQVNQEELKGLDKTSSLSWLKTQSSDFKLGFVRAIFTADGSVRKQNNVELYSINKHWLEVINLILQEFGIRSTLTTHNNAKSYLSSGSLTRNNKKTFKLNVHSGQFKRVGFISDYKQKLVSEQKDEGFYRRKDYETIVDISLDSVEDVYDITVNDKSHAFIDSGAVAHNCVEISLRPFQMCNLCEINAGTIVSQDDFNSRARVAAFIGTLQAGHTDFHFLRDIWKETTEKDALLGVGMTGIAAGNIFNFDQAEAAKIAKSENERVAKQIGINRASRVTTVKPSGTSSCVLGVSSGIHAWHDQYYIRRIIINKEEPIHNYLKENLGELMEDSFYKPNLESVLSIPIRAPDGAILRTEETAISLLERVKNVSYNWVKTGHRKGDNTNNVSCTVSVKENEWDSVRDWMWENKETYNGLSVLPYDGGNYAQTPFQSISKESYEAMVKLLKNIDLTQVIEEEDNTSLKENIACAGGACEV